MYFTLGLKELQYNIEELQYLKITLPRELVKWDI